MTYQTHLFQIKPIDATSNRVLRQTAKVFSSALKIPLRGFIYVRRLPDGEMAVAPVFGGFLAAMARGSRQSLDVFVTSDNPATIKSLAEASDLLKAELERKLGASGCSVEHIEMAPMEACA